MAKVYYVGDWAAMLGPVFAEAPFNYAFSMRSSGGMPSIGSFPVEHKLGFPPDRLTTIFSVARNDFSRKKPRMNKQASPRRTILGVLTTVAMAVSVVSAAAAEPAVQGQVSNAGALVPGEAQGSPKGDAVSAARALVNRFLPGRGDSFLLEVGSTC